MNERKPFSFWPGCATMEVQHIDFPERRDGYGAADTEKTPAGVCA